MIIVNPLYDTGFKFLMEDPVIATSLLEAIVGVEILHIEFAAQEQILSGERETAQVFRLDFVAVVRTPEGEKRITIEVQKSNRESNIARFRSYIGTQYAGKGSPDPLITIYILGYNLPSLPESVVGIERVAKGKITRQELPVKDPHIDFLSHDMYLVQVKRLRSPYRTHLESFLQVFDQTYKMDNKQYLLEIPEEELNPDALRMAKRLEMLVADQTARRQLELEAQVEWEYEIDFGKLKREAELAKQQIVEAGTRAEGEKLRAEEAILRAEEEKLRAEEEKLQKEIFKKRSDQYLDGHIRYLHLTGNTPEEIARLTDLPVDEVERRIQEGKR